MSAKLNLKSYFVRPLKSFLLAGVLYFALIAVASLLVWLLPIPEKWAVYYCIGSMCICCLLVGFLSSKQFQRRGFLVGAAYAFIFLSLLLLLHSIIFGALIKIDISAVKFIICIMFGSVGGMVGVNVKTT